MAVNLYSFVDLYTRILDTAAHILAKGAAHAAATGVSDAEMLSWRLIDDMEPLGFQIAVIGNFTRQWPARVVGIPTPPDIPATISLSQFIAEIAAARQFVASLTPAQFEGRDDAPLKVSIGSGQMEPTLPAGRWLTVFATTNLYFHLSIAYAIMRARGVPLGKVDMFPTGL